MKVKDLIEILKGMDPDLDVYSYDKEGDYTSVQQKGGVEVAPYTPPVVFIHGGYPG